MPLSLFTSRQLISVITDDRIAKMPTYFLDNFFAGNEFYSTAQQIAFEEVPSNQIIAPYALPNEEGRPINFREGTEIKSFAPAYIKVKDALRATDAFVRQPGELIPGGITGSYLTPAQRMANETARILTLHSQAIDRNFDFMAAQAVINARAVINYGPDSKTPSVVLDFGRDPAHTVIKGNGDHWGDSGVSLRDDLRKWMYTMQMAFGGGTPTLMLIGTQVSQYIQKALLDGGELNGLMSNQFYGSTGVNLTRDIVVSGDWASPARSLGYITGGLEVVEYSGNWVDPTTKTLKPILDPRDIVLISPNFSGFQCFGAIYDTKQGLFAQKKFPKMWDEEDPSATYIMTQSAPLMVPTNVNSTFHARVLG